MHGVGDKEVYGCPLYRTKRSCSTDLSVRVMHRRCCLRSARCLFNGRPSYTYITVELIFKHNRRWHDYTINIQGMRFHSCLSVPDAWSEATFLAHVWVCVSLRACVGALLCISPYASLANNRYETWARGLRAPRALSLHLPHTLTSENFREPSLSPPVTMN